MNTGYPGLPVNLAQIKNALFALAQGVTFTSPINGATTWKTSSRRLRLWANVDPSEQPAMFMVQHREGYMQSGVGRLTKRYLDMGFYCYASSGDPSTGIIGDDLLDLMLSGLEAALAPDDPQRVELTLKGLVFWVRIMRTDNLFIRDPGDIDGQALLVLPVRILLP